MNDADLQASCSRRLSGHHPVQPADAFRRLADHPSAQQGADIYGAGGAAAELETRTRELMGKDQALFFIKGMIAQMAVLRVAAEKAKSPNILIHPMSHLDQDEEGAAWHLHDLRPIRLGKYAPFSLAQLEAVTEPLGAIVVELPLRRSGYLLPRLDELRAISTFARERQIHLHFDGARLWESAAGYDIPLDQLAGLADSVYVSFYKGLGGLGGAAVAGEAAFVQALRVWRTRHGGNLYRVYPYAVSALDGLDRQLPRMAAYVKRARDLAGALAGEPRLALTPKHPDVNACHLLMPGTVDELTVRNRAFAEERGIWMFNGFYESPVEGCSIAEVVIGESSDDYEIAEAAGWIRDFLDA